MAIEKSFNVSIQLTTKINNILLTNRHGFNDKKTGEVGQNLHINTTSTQLCQLSFVYISIQKVVRMHNDFLSYRGQGMYRFFLLTHSC